jgi:hypothetical protein
MLLPGPGTSPCTTATVAGRSSVNEYGTSTGSEMAAQTATRTPAPTSRSERSRSRTTQASRKPTSARRKLSPVEPTYGSACATGVSTTPNARRPNGMPLNGQSLRAASIVTQAAASQAGQNRSRWSSPEAAPSRL